MNVAASALISHKGYLYKTGSNIKEGNYITTFLFVTCFHDVLQVVKVMMINAHTNYIYIIENTSTAVGRIIDKSKCMFMCII